MIKKSGKTGRKTQRMTEGPPGIAKGSPGLSEGFKGSGGTDGRTNEISPHSTGLRPLSGPLPKKRSITDRGQDNQRDRQKDK